ncbi:MAG: hypothetical protein ACFB14_17055 [Leptolyngbyaceae cyanobacterium]
MMAASTSNNQPRRLPQLPKWQAIKSGLPLDQVSQRILKWFVVDDTEVASILKN